MHAPDVEKLSLYRLLTRPSPAPGIRCRIAWAAIPRAYRSQGPQHSFAAACTTLLSRLQLRATLIAVHSLSSLFSTHACIEEFPVPGSQFSVKTNRPRLRTTEN